jgi:hypothetical protein
MKENNFYIVNEQNILNTVNLLGGGSSFEDELHQTFLKCDQWIALAVTSLPPAHRLVALTYLLSVLPSLSSDMGKRWRRFSS